MPQYKNYISHQYHQNGDVSSVSTNKQANILLNNKEEHLKTL